MSYNFKITPRDMVVAAKFCRAIQECQVDTDNCIFIMPTRNTPCVNCPVMNFKMELLAVAQPFVAGWQRLLRTNAVTLEVKIKAVWHLFVGLGALYSVNQKKIPPISQDLIDEIHGKIHQDPIGCLREITSELKNLGGEWYVNFRSSWEMLRFPDDTMWIDNILLLYVFLEAMRLSSSPDPKNSKEPIEPWKSEQDRKDFSDFMENWIRQEAKKKKDDNK